MTCTTLKREAFRLADYASASGQNLFGGRGSRSRLETAHLSGISAGPRDVSIGGQALSMASGLALLALVVCWLAQVIQWSFTRVAAYGVSTFSASPADSRLATYLNYLALGVFVLAGVFNAIRFRQIPISIPVWLYLMLACGAFWLLVGYEPAEWRFALAPDGPLTLVMCVGIYAGCDQALWKRLRWVVLLIAFATSFLGIYYSVRLASVGVFEGPTPMNQHLVTAFWFALFAMLAGGWSSWKGYLLALIPMGLCIPNAIMIASRSWTLLSATALLFGLIIMFQRCFRILSVRTVISGLIFLMLLGAGAWGLAMAMPDQMEIFTDRLEHDTRSAQYSQFFEQVPVFDLITGRGPKATYHFSDKGDYSYIDNQFLFILFRYGLPMCLGYCAIVLWPGWWVWLKGGGHSERLLGGYFIFWTLAMLGVSIYHGIFNNPQNLLAILLSGRCLALRAELQGRPVLG